MTIINKSYSKKIIESGVLNDKQHGDISTNEKLRKYQLTRTTYYDYMKLEPLAEILVENDLSKKQCFELLSSYNDLLKTYEHHTVLRVIKTKLAGSLDNLQEGNFHEELTAHLEQENQPFNTIDKLIRNHYHVLDIMGRGLPVQPKVNVNSNKDMQLFAIAQWSLLAKTEDDVEGITNVIRQHNNSFIDLIDCKTPYDLILSVAMRLWVGLKEEKDIATIFRASELLITNKSLLAKPLLKILTSGYDKNIPVD